MALVLALLYFCFSSFSRIRKAMKKPALVNNFLISDDPISSTGQDHVNFSPIIEKLTAILLHDEHPKSISIGLVGPWGNGKSSLIQLVKNNIDKSEQFKKKEIISIHFLPYLNHNESEIINEFFTLLSNQLAPYNGKLSNQILDYSEKLTDLYQNKNLKNFLENHVTNFSKSSACELYENINVMLGETDKKIIVFIDDLDRLNQKEILQTLKLIRNTANFTNTFFVLAMDKQYVIKRLTAKGNILDTKFVDKFFQLEIYLPEIENSLLKKYFISEMLRPFSPAPTDLEIRLNAALMEPNLLFEDYIKNFRDVKRVVNQIKYDISLFNEDFYYLNLTDFINFTFFKLKFPNMVKQLNDSRGDFLTVDKIKGTYKLKEVPKDQKNMVENIIYSSANESIGSIKHLDCYELYAKIIREGDFSSPNEKNSRSDNLLLVKTMAHLFGNENTPEGQDSIRFINNFQMLVQQRIFPNYFKQAEFDALFSADSQSLKSELLNIKAQGKSEQLIGRLNYFLTDNPEKIRRTIECLTIIYEMDGVESHYNLDTFKLIEKFAAQLYEALGEGRIKEYQKWLDKSLFSNDSYSDETRFFIIITIWKIKDMNELWKLEKFYITNKAVELFEKFLSRYETILWDVDNFRIYSLYHGVKLLNKNKVNKILKDFWHRNSIELLCVQFTELDPFSNTAFRISETVTEIFGSRDKYIDFVKAHKDSPMPEIKEFIDLFKLLKAINFQYTLEYDFEQSPLMLSKIRISENEPGREGYGQRERDPQVIVKITDTDLGYHFVAEANYKEKYGFSFTISQDVFYLTINVRYEKIDSLLSDFVEDIMTMYNNNPNWIIDQEVITEGMRIELKGTDYIEFISIKPRPNEVIKYLKK
ncbi:KAP family P-loop NTPase fold protein [Flavobacterium hibisci]|uniref:KAP family P-loop NTPase fold protein n=1 Tax=Flavobacterium hibisci TaxID=1914462 RepID=UPI001CBF0F6D|nr:P-loop NTPase fold protein [Flavobacterium hibisci]MBZ4042612.1 KAP family NTPase [Flavobacterium hibisci]